MRLGLEALHLTQEKRKKFGRWGEQRCSDWREDYDVGRKRLVGNFPQAFSHIALANAAFDLSARARLRERAHHHLRYETADLRP